MNQSLLNLLPDLLKKNSNEYCGPCPWCGGKDRFIVWPHQGKGGKFLCRQCQQKGDCIDFLRSQGMSFIDAKQWVNGNSHEYQYSFKSNNSNITDSKSIDKELWSQAALKFIDESINALNVEHKAVLEKKCISYQTALKFKIGWNERDQFVNASDWGLDQGKLVIPQGLVIPIYMHDQISAIKIRCRDPHKYHKYRYIKGSRKSPMILGDIGLPVIIVESELDAILIWQEASTYVSVVALSGLGFNLDPSTLEFVRSCPKIFISTDFDEPTDANNIGPGQNSFLNLQKILPNATYFPTPTGKDPSEMHSSGTTILEWISCIPKFDIPKSKTEIPADYPGKPETLIKSLGQYPHLIPCPLTAPKWYWKYRKDCGLCSGHIHCVKDLNF